MVEHVRQICCVCCAVPEPPGPRPDPGKLVHMDVADSCRRARSLDSRCEEFVISEEPTQGCGSIGVGFRWVHCQDRCELCPAKFAADEHLEARNAFRRILSKEISLISVVADQYRYDSLP